MGQRIGLARCVLVAMGVGPAVMVLAAADARAQFDVTGTWATYGRFDDPAETENNAPGYRHGTTEVDAAGDVVGGGETDDEGTSTSHLGGSFDVSASGSVDGSITNAQGTDAFIDHQLDSSSTLLVGVDTDPSGAVGFDGAVKRSGEYSMADLEGRWWHVVHWDDPAAFNDPGHDALQITIDELGIVRSVAGTSTRGPDLMVADTTQFTIDATGAVGIPTLPDAHLQMAPNKQTILGVMSDPGGYVAGGALIRDDGSGFTTADLEGHWLYYSFWDRNPDVPSASYGRGVLELDADGDLVSGTWQLRGQSPSALVGGGFGINGGGTVFGQVEVETGARITFGNIELNADGNFGAGTYRNATNHVFTFLVLPEPGEAGAALAAFLTLWGLAARGRHGASSSMQWPGGISADA